MVDDVMMALAVVVLCTCYHYDHLLKFLSFTLGFGENWCIAYSLSVWQTECMWKTACFSFFALSHKFISTLVSGIKTDHLLNLCKSLRTGKCSQKSLIIVNGISESFAKKFFLYQKPGFTYLPAHVEYLKSVGRFYRHTPSAFTQYLLVHSYAS